MKKYIEFYAIPHCKLPECTLVSNQWECPNCDSTNTTYDLYYDYEDCFIDENKSLDIKCEDCDKEYKIKYDSKEYEWYYKE